MQLSFTHSSLSSVWVTRRQRRSTTETVRDNGISSGRTNLTCGYGAGTFFTPGLGACGRTNTENDHIAAVSHQFFDSFGCVLAREALRTTMLTSF